MTRTDYHHDEAGRVYLDPLSAVAGPRLRPGKTVGLRPRLSS